MYVTCVTKIDYIAICVSHGLVESPMISSVPPIIGLFCGDSAASCLITSLMRGIEEPVRFHVPLGAQRWRESESPRSCDGKADVSSLTSIDQTAGGQPSVSAHQTVEPKARSMLLSGSGSIFSSNTPTRR